MRVGDQVVAFDGRRVESQADQGRVWKSHAAGDSVRLTVLRPGQTAPLELTGVFRRNSDLAGTAGSLQEAADRLLRTSLLLAFAAVGLVILLLRPEDRNVWLLACFFAGIISAPGFPDDFQTVPAALRPWVEAYKGIFLGTLGASFYFLCAVFPARSPIDRRLPWLKWVARGPGIGGRRRDEAPGCFAARRHFVENHLPSGLPTGSTFGIALGFLVLGLVSLAANYFFAGEPQTRRKIRVIFWGTVVGLGPPLIRAGARAIHQLPVAGSGWK